MKAPDCSLKEKIWFLDSCLHSVRIGIDEIDEDTPCFG